jgi:hypothetical protein
VSDGNETNNPAPVNDETEEPQGAAPVHEAHEPHIQVLKGEPTAEELAALIAVLGSAAGPPLRPAVRPTPPPGTAGTQPVGAARRQTALPRLQLAEDHPAGTDAYAAMTRI